MKALLLLIWFPVIAAAQAPADVVKQGADLFAKTCANGYCHGDQGVGGGAPRLAARGFDQALITNTLTRGIPNTAMQSFANSLSRADLTAVIAYVAKLNGISTPASVQNAPQPASAAALSAAAARGRGLFSDAVRGFSRCSTCHEVNGIGIPVAAPLASVPQTAAALKSLATPRVSTVMVAGESMPALILARKSQAVSFYDLTIPPPVLRTELPAAVQIRDGSNWRHASVIGSYTDAELSTILEYLLAVSGR
jgi:mono/diheme cytochrome c family protein